MLWDLYTDHAVTWATILIQWDLANPHNWNGSGDLTGVDYPSTRMSTAAGPLGYQAAYDTNAGFNGTWR